MKHVFVAVVTITLWCSAAAGAQTPPDPVRDALPQIDAVMGHQDALHLSDAQKAAITNDVLNARQRFEPAQHKLQDAYAKLVEILRSERVDQTRALSQLDVVLAREREIKRLQISLMIQVKNELTPAQQEMARQYTAAGSK
jgi:Spy/CpxP family protein refolding chaperone